MFRLAKNIWLSPIVGDASQKTHNLKHNTNNMSSARSESKMATKIVFPAPAFQYGKAQWPAYLSVQVHRPDHIS